MLGKELNQPELSNPADPIVKETSHSLEQTGENVCSRAQEIAKVSRPCPMCGSADFSFVAAGREHEFMHTTEDLFYVVRCRSCNLVFLNPRPDDSMLEIIYPADYHCHVDSFARTAGAKSLWVALRRKLHDAFGFPRQIRNILKSLPIHPQRTIDILDIGCGNGEALDVFAKEAPMAVVTTGLDFSAPVLQRVAAKGHKTILQNISDLQLDENAYDVIYCANVIEHLADPMDLLRNTHKALRSGGLFICETPNFDSLDSHLFAGSGHWGGYHFPRHWTFFTRETLSKMATEAGLRIETIRYKPAPIVWVWSMHSYLYHGRGWKETADRWFPVKENESTFFRFFFNVVLYHLVDLFQLLIFRKTGMMIAFMRK
jgi:2-polyprenyl-3-methyl-5-hydroxy-6-metoxy-1,4-benzoquinol methylase